MKTQMKPLPWALALLTLLSAPDLASAYYDPGVQRWINRDPVAERGGANLSVFLLNDSIGHVDYFGLKEACCGPQKQTYDPDKQCCEDGQVVDKVSIWICTRAVLSWWGSTGPGHQDVCCDGPYRNCYGHTDNHLKMGDPIPVHYPVPDGSRGCREKKICPKGKKAHCDHPVSPCRADSVAWNCRDWANWGGVTPPFGDPCPDPLFCLAP
jgi:hypothetical protein